MGTTLIKKHGGQFIWNYSLSKKWVMKFVRAEYRHPMMPNSTSHSLHSNENSSDYVTFPVQTYSQKRAAKFVRLGPHHENLKMEQLGWEFLSQRREMFFKAFELQGCMGTKEPDIFSRSWRGSYHCPVL